MTKEEMIAVVVDGHMDDVEGWLLNDRESLRAWLQESLGLMTMSAKEIRSKFSAYFDDQADEIGADVAALLKDIYDEADHIDGTEAPRREEVSLENARNIKRWAKEAIEKLEEL